MTNDNDLIRRGAILELCQTLEDEAPSGSYDNGGTTDGWMMACRRVEKAIAALPAVAASQDADADLLFDAYKGLLVLHRILDKHGLIVGAETTNKLADRIVAAHPEFPPRTALRSAVAASQPADPVINADSCQRVVVKPLVWEEVNPGVFVAKSSLGVWSRFDGHYMRPDASGGIASDNPEAAAQADYAARIMSAIDVHPDPRDAQIAALVEAIQANIVFAENIADALDVDPDKTCLNVRVMPEGREVASKSWADVMREGRAALAAVKGGAA